MDFSILVFQRFSFSAFVFGLRRRADGMKPRTDPFTGFIADERARNEDPLGKCAARFGLTGQTKSPMFCP
jgi:hypothetical protein